MLAGIGIALHVGQAETAKRETRRNENQEDTMANEKRTTEEKLQDQIAMLQAQARSKAYRGAWIERRVAGIVDGVKARIQGGAELSSEGLSLDSGKPERPLPASKTNGGSGKPVTTAPNPKAFETV